MDASGPTGPGLLLVNGVPEASVLRRKLLPWSSDLALLDRERLARILKEHHLGTDIPTKDPRRVVSSFGMQLRYGEGVKSSKAITGNSVDTSGIEHDFPVIGVTMEFQPKGFDGLGSSFKELGLLIIEMGVARARVCDQSIGSNELEQCLMESGTAKGRLIHYHSVTDYIALEKNGKKKCSKKGVGSSRKPRERLWLGVNLTRATRFPVYGSNGITTTTSLQSFIIQNGESADILSRRKLGSTLYCVCRPKNPENASRETLVVFSQPAWSIPLSLSKYPRDQLFSAISDVEQSADEPCVSDQNKKKVMEEIQKKIPPLVLGIKDGVTLAEFALETTRQYYGSSGLQSNR